MINPSYNLLNQQKLLKSNASKEEKILAQAKLEVFETLDLSWRKPIKIGDIAYQIFESRKKTWSIPSEIKIDWNALKIDQNSYRNVFDNYNNFLWENNQKGIELTDRDLAQRLILDSGNMIVFEDDKVAAEKNFEELNQDKKYQGLIELIQKKRNNKDLSLIKRTEEEYEKIKKKFETKKITNDINFINEQIKKTVSFDQIKEDDFSSDMAKEKFIELKKEWEEKTRWNFSMSNLLEELIIYLDNFLSKKPIEKKQENTETITEEIENKKPKENNNTEKTPESKEILRKWLLVNRDNLADKIRELREWSGFSNISEIEIQSGVFIDIKKNKEIYTNFLEQYLQNEWDKKELEKLDTQFSEMLIISRPENVPMDQKYWIQINNDEPWKDIKSQEELEAEAKRCEESLKKNGYDVEYIKISQKTNSNREKELEDMKSYIDEIQKIIAELKSELDSKFLYSNETDRVRKQDELQKKKDKLAKLQNDFDKLLEEILLSKINPSRKKELEDMKSYIDEIQKIIAELESELDSKFLYSDETDRVRKQDELQKKKDKLAKLQSDFDRLLEEIKKEILENDNKIYHVIRQKKQKELWPHTEKTKDDKQILLPQWPDQKKSLPEHEGKIVDYIDWQEDWSKKKEQQKPSDDLLIIDDRKNKDGWNEENKTIVDGGENNEEDYSKTTPPIHTPVPPTPTQKNDKRTATISNVESVHLEEANNRAEEAARKEYEALGKLNLFDAKTRKARERMKTFALRSVRRQKIRNRHLSSVKWNVDLTREDVVFASDRHEMESGDRNWNGTITRRLTSHQNPDIDLLCKEFLTTKMSDIDFETKFNAILRLDPTVTAIIGNNNMDYLASNILLKLKNEKAEYTMVDEISKLLVTGTTYNATNFQAQLNTITGKYFTETKKNYPNYIQKILDNINDPIEINKIIKHQQGLLNEDVKTLQMQLQLLDNTTGAYEIDNKDKERWFWYKFGAWMDRHPYLTVGWSILAGTWILATGWLIGWVAWAATATWLIATKIGMMTAAKKASHYTKEQKGQEKRLTHGLNIEKQAMDNIRTVMNNAPWYSWRKYKATRQFKLYQESTQKNIADTTRLTEFINRFVSIPGTLPPTEEAALSSYLSNGLARVDYYKKTGHNFVASQDKTKVEIDMRNLYTAITQWAEKLGTDITTIRWNTQYTYLVGDLTDDYDASMENFKTQRRNLELKYGIWAGMLYAWTAVWLQYVLGSGIFGNYPCGWTQIVVPWTDELALHEEVKTSLANAWATQQNITNIENALKNAPTSASADWYNQHAWRTIVKNEMWWQDTQLNSWMHDFMKDTLWTLNEWWSEFQRQLLDANINSLTSTSPAAKTAEAFLSSPKIGLINEGEWAKVLADLQKFIADPNSIAQFTAEEKMKMWYYGHMFIGNDIWIENNSWIISRLTEQLTKMTTVWWTTIPAPEEICNRHYWLDGVGMPVFANTFMERMQPNKDEVWKPIESTKEDPVPDPTIVIADKNNPASTSPTPTYSWLTGK